MNITANGRLTHGFRIELDISGHGTSNGQNDDHTLANEGRLKEKDTQNGVTFDFSAVQHDDPPPLPQPLPPRKICACPFENSCLLPVVFNSEFCGGCTSMTCRCRCTGCVLMGRKKDFDFEEKDESWMSQIIAWWNKNPQYDPGVDWKKVKTSQEDEYKQQMTQTTLKNENRVPHCEDRSTNQSLGNAPQRPSATPTNSDLVTDSSLCTAFTVGGVIVGGSSGSGINLHVDLPPSAAIGSDILEGQSEFNLALHHHKSILPVDRDYPLPTNFNFKSSGSRSGLSKEVCETDFA